MSTIFIAGCFDGGLHKGHLYLLSEARKLGDKLTVAVNSDAHVARKGPGRPLNTFSDRVASLYDTGLVDMVYQIEDSPLEVILDIQPDVIVVGDDYTIDRVVGAKECAEWGGRVVIVTRIPNISTTQLIESHGQDHTD